MWTSVHHRLGGTVVVKHLQHLQHLRRAAASASEQVKLYYNGWTG